VGKIAKKQFEGVFLLQTAFSAILPTGLTLIKTRYINFSIIKLIFFPVMERRKINNILIIGEARS